MQIGHHRAWSFTTYGLLGLAASTGEIVGTVGAAFRTYMTEATATTATASKATARRIFLIINLPFGRLCFVTSFHFLRPRRLSAGHGLHFDDVSLRVLHERQIHVQAQEEETIIGRRIQPDTLRPERRCKRKQLLPVRADRRTNAVEIIFTDIGFEHRRVDGGDRLLAWLVVRPN